MHWHRSHSQRLGEARIARQRNLEARFRMFRRALHISTTAMMRQDNSVADDRMPSWREVFLCFLFLGFVNIGGPVAQITMMFNHMVEKRRWLSKDRFIKIMAFCHMLPGPEALQLAIYIGYLKRKIWGGVLAGITFILPGAIAMIVLSWLYVRYGRLPQVTDALYVLKPAVLGIIAAGIIKLGRAAIRNVFLAFLLVGAFIGMRFAGINFLLILLIAGLLNLIVERGSTLLKRTAPTLPVMLVGTSALLPFSDSRLFQIASLFFKTGLLSFGGAYASLVFVQQGAVAQYRWLSDGQLLDGVALSVATPGPFMLFTTFVGYVAGGISGAVLATFFVFLPSFIFVLGGVHYIEKVRENCELQAFLAGVSAAVVGVIAVVSLDLIPQALVDWVTLGISLLAFILIAFLKRDVALVAIGAIIGGLAYAGIRMFA